MRLRVGGVSGLSCHMGPYGGKCPGELGWTGLALVVATGCSVLFARAMECY